jgi:hypothetical protein
LPAPIKAESVIDAIQLIANLSAKETAYGTPAIMATLLLLDKYEP